VQAIGKELTLNLDGDKTIKAVFREPAEWSGSGGDGVGSISIKGNWESISVLIAGIGFMLFLLGLVLYLSFGQNRLFKEFRRGI